MASRQRSGASDSSPGAGALDLHEGLSASERQRAKPECTCRPEHLRLRSSHGELVTPRGRAVNRCDYCAKLAAVENCEMLSLDAMEGDAPTGLLVLTTRTSTVDMAGFYRALSEIKRALKRRWPAFEYASLVEFTTGYAERSGGLRRPHWNLLTKGIPADELDAAGAIAFPIWCRHVDAEQHVQYVDPIRTAGALTKYLALHFQKASQQPPANFTGQRFNCSRGYFTGATRAQARARARDALALKRELHKLGQVIDDAHERELAAQLAHRRNLATTWTLASETGGRLGDAVLTPTTLAERLRAQMSANAPTPRPVEPF